MTISSDPKSCLNTLTYSRFKLDCKKWVSHSTKGQLISKSNCHVVNSSKRRTNEVIFSTMRCVSVCFLEGIEDTKKPFEIT